MDEYTALKILQRNQAFIINNIPDEVAECSRAAEMLLLRKTCGEGQRLVTTSRVMGSSKAGKTSTVGDEFCRLFFDSFLIFPGGMDVSSNPSGKFHHPTREASYVGALLRSGDPGLVGDFPS